MLEIHVDVRRLVAFPGEEALKQQRRPLRVHLGDAQGVAHHRIGRRTPPLAQDALAPGETDDVVHREKEGLVAQLGDQAQFLLYRLADRLGRAPGIALSQSGLGFTTQVAGGGLPRGHHLLRVFVAQFVERELTAGDDPGGFAQQLGRIEPGQAQGLA